MTDSPRDDQRTVGVDRQQKLTRALIVVPVLASGLASGKSSPQRSEAARCEEMAGLAAAIHLDIDAVIPIPLRAPKPSTLLGQGRVDDIRETAQASDVELVLVDHALTPVQQRNLERAWSVKVLDRTALILEIFGDRARTKEGRLQVELAHLTYQKGRLVRSWTHLERQRGGVGFLGGPGETQIEADRRQLQEKIGRLEKDLEKVRKTRNLHRAKRKKTPQPVVALVGYTNAGKSTLFNRMTEARVLAKDLLFATLDPTLRAVKLPNGTEIILSDTVGFISDLPTHLVAAFRATLEEVIEADLILHVRDIAHEDSAIQADDVRQVLGDLGIEDKPGSMIEIWNKIDLLPSDDQPRHIQPVGTMGNQSSTSHPPKSQHDTNQHGIAQQATALQDKGPAPQTTPSQPSSPPGYDPLARDSIQSFDGSKAVLPSRENGGGSHGSGAKAMPVSALTGQGVNGILAAIENHLNAERQTYTLTLPVQDGAEMAWLYQACEVLERQDRETGVTFHVRVPQKQHSKFINKFKKII